MKHFSVQHYFKHGISTSLIMWMLLSGSTIANEQIVESVINIPPPNSLDSNGRPSFFFEKLLQLALSKVNDKQFTVQYFPRPTAKEQVRKILIRNQGIDLLWSSSNTMRETEMLAIKVNLLKGVNEYHVLLIRKDDQTKFDQVKTMDDLLQFQVGLGSHWSDLDVFQKNRFKIFIYDDYDSMFATLSRKRFDFIPRAIQEVDKEIDRYSHLNIAEEKNLLLHYKQPIYFFVHKANVDLAKRIEKGLKIAQKDGSFDKLFFDVPEFKSAHEKLERNGRKIIELPTD